MTYARGSSSSISYVKEVTPGTTPTSPTMQALRTTGDTLELTKDTLESGEIRDDRQITVVRHGNKQTGGDINLELSYSTYDDLLEGAFYGTWSTPGSAIAATVTGFTIATATTITWASGDDGTVVGNISDQDWLEISGSAVSGNNIHVQVLDIDDTSRVITVDRSLTTESANTSIVLTPLAALKTAKTLSSFTFEKLHTDITQYRLFKGMAVNSFNLAVSAGAMATGSMGFLGMDGSLVQTSLGTPVAAPTTSPLDAFSGVVREGGSAISSITSLDMTLNNSLEAANVIGSNIAQAIVEGRSNVTGTVEAFFVDNTLIDKFIEESSSSLEVELTDPAGNKYVLFLPNIKYLSADTPVDGEGLITTSLGFQALLGTASGSNIWLVKIPA